MSPGRKPRRSPASTARAAKDDFLDRARDHHRHADRDGQICLARAGWPDSKAHFIGEKIGDIGLLRFGPRRDRLFAGAQFEVATAKHLDLIGAFAAHHIGHWLAHAYCAINITCREIAARFQSGVKRAQNRCRLFARARIPDYRKTVTPSQHIHTHLMLDLRQVAVVFAA
jgi:hypothetical protein